MAESVVFHLLANFAPFLQEEVNLLTGVRDEIEYIRGEFERMTAFLRVADAMEETDPGLAVWVKQVRESAYDTADALDMHLLRLGHHCGTGVRGFLRKVALLGDDLRLLTLLDLEGTQLETFPNELAQASAHYQTGFKAPMGIGSLSSLQKLCSIEANHDNGIVLREVGKLTQLRRVRILQLRGEDGKVLCSSLEKLKNLRSLFVRATQVDEIIDLDSLPSPPQFLRTLYLVGHLQRLPRWIPYAFNLVRVCLRYSKLRDADPLQSLQDLPNLAALEIVKAYDGRGTVELLADDLRLLTLLDLEGTQLETFPNEVVKLYHLRHLSLRRTNLKTIPKSIGNLQNLETLDLKETLVTELPNEILKLHRLRHLLLYHYDPMLLPSSFHAQTGFKALMGIGSLSSLQKLCSIEANHDNNDDIVLREVGKLTQLRRVHILKLRREDGKVLCSSLEKLKNLRSLLVHAIQEDEIIDLDSLSSVPQHLRTLYVRGHLQRLPRWISSAFNLVKVCLWNSMLRDADPLRSLQGLPNLAYLEIFNAYDEEELCFKAGAFQNLETLYLGELKELIRVRVEASSMPRLKKLSIVTCKLMEDLPSGIEYLTNLESLHVVAMPYSFVSRVSRNLQGRDHWKVSHIREVFIWGRKDGD
ncbi:hypothetical protein Acr_25g0010130 [Actinidia rufa]|uniref:Leucine-rich repeat (LRR) family protein n=1 Tax=Actinidia rufa TaxID=165716 RepID=A0A7J0H1H0_9ERIC|nr:hypothetical protein Acr_25g0010130 [Actinidia rufa]